MMIQHACIIPFFAVLAILPTANGDDRALSISLAEADRDRCLAVLREGLASSEFWPSMHAAEGLSADDRGAEVREALAPKLPNETDAQHRCGLARELVRAGDLAFVRVLLEVLAGPDPYGHGHACESLFKVNQIGDGGSLRSAMETNGSGPTLRTVMAAAALARWGSPAAAAHVRTALNHDDETIARTAAWVLARVGAAADVPAIRTASGKSQAPLTRAYFDHALASLGDADGRTALVRNLGSDDPAVRTQAAEFVPIARVLEARDALLPMLRDSALDVRVRAAHALLAIARPSPPTGDEFATDVFPSTQANPRYSEGSVIVLRDGRLLYSTTEFAESSSDFARARIIAVESADDGRTWGPRRVLQENVGKTNVMSVTLRRLLPGSAFDGPIGFFYLVKNTPTDLHVYLRISNDEGATFGEPIPVTADPGYHVLNNDRVTVLSTGRIVVPVASSVDGEKNDHYISACYLSDDRGRTWRRGRGEVDYARRGAMEPEVLELKDGRLLMHLRTQVGQIAVSESNDGGETWTEAKSWGVVAPEAPSTLRRIPSTGDLLLVWNDTFQAGQGHGGQRTPLSAAVSTDEGKTWSKPIVLEPDPQQTYAYTSLIFHHGRALLTYYVGTLRWDRLSSRFRSVPIGRFYGRK